MPRARLATSASVSAIFQIAASAIMPDMAAAGVGRIRRPIGIWLMLVGTGVLAVVSVPLLPPSM
jgi:hypothetical protein